MKARDIEIGGVVPTEDGQWAERVPARLFRQAWGTGTPKGQIPFVVKLPDGRWGWHLLDADADVEQHERVEEWLQRN